MKIIVSDTKVKNVFVLSNKFLKKFSLKTNVFTIDDHQLYGQKKMEQ
jgi:hypothetical protein